MFTYQNSTLYLSNVYICDLSAEKKKTVNMKLDKLHAGTVT